MKKIFLFLSLVVIVACPMSAQTSDDHMKFIGIPLDGTITQFQQKLLAKGYTIRKDVNAILPIGTRAFKGTFIGRKANIAVYYDETSKIVYAAKAYFDDLTENRAKEELENVKELLEQKYPDAYISELEENHLPKISLLTFIGTIQIYIQKSESFLSYPYIYSLHIQYNDIKNSAKHEDNIMDDL
ncbi:MAG: hypothetical protein IKH14_04715 [Prevotella sp.]|nr:hypothetical protein [Prevotella sp.]